MAGEERCDFQQTDSISVSLGPRACSPLWFYSDYEENDNPKEVIVKHDDTKSLERPEQEFTLQTRSLTDSDAGGVASSHFGKTENESINQDDESGVANADLSTVASTQAEGFSMPYRTSDQLAELQPPLVEIAYNPATADGATHASDDLLSRSGHSIANTVADNQ